MQGSISAPNFGSFENKINKNKNNKLKQENKGS